VLGCPSLCCSFVIVLCDLLELVNSNKDTQNTTQREKKLTVGERTIKAMQWNYERQSKSTRNSWRSTAWCTMSLHRLDSVFLVISTCKFCTCAMQFGVIGATSGRDSGFYITITHRATHRLLCSNSFHHPVTVLSESRFE
jgi:hypothetical protein